MVQNTEPFEILAGPAEIWVAPEGTVFPDVDTPPIAPWTRIAQATQIPEEGVTISGDQTSEPVYSLGGTGTRKGFRTRQEVHVTFGVMNATAEAYSAALNNNAVADTAAGAGTPGFRRVQLSMPGGAILTRALLVRVDQSPYGDGLAAQWEFPRAYNVGSPETVYTKGSPVTLAFDYFVMDDANGDKGSYVAQDAIAI